MGAMSARSQNVESFRAVEIRYGRTGTTGDQFTLRHERYMSQQLNLAVQGSMELSRKNLMNYQAYTVDALAEYYTGLGYKTNDDFQAKAGVGVTMSYQTEPELYKGFTTLRKLNYGIIFQASGEWAFTTDLSLTAFASQRLYKKKYLGMFNYDFGVGIKFKIY